MNEIALPLCSISNWVQVQIGVYGSAGNRVWRAPGVIAHDIPLFSSTGMCPEMDSVPAGAPSDNLQRVTLPLFSRRGRWTQGSSDPVDSEQANAKNIYKNGKHHSIFVSKSLIFRWEGRHDLPVVVLKLEK